MKNPVSFLKLRPEVSAPIPPETLGASRCALLFNDPFLSQYDDAAVNACVQQLRFMPQQEFDTLMERKADPVHPLDHVALMWYIASPSQKDVPVQPETEVPLVWTRERILNYMDDLSGRNPATLSAADAIATYTGWMVAVPMAAWGVEKVVDWSKECMEKHGLWAPGVAMGFGVLALALNLHDFGEIREVKNAIKHAFAEGDGHLAEKRKELFPWKISTPEHPFPVFEALTPKPTAWKDIQGQGLNLSRDLQLRLSRCPVNQMGKALVNPTRAEAIVDQHEQIPLNAQMTQLVSRLCERITGLDAKEVRFRQQEESHWTPPPRVALGEAVQQRPLPPAPPSLPAPAVSGRNPVKARRRP